MEARELSLGNITDKGIVHTIRYNNGLLGCDILDNRLDSFSNFYSFSELNPVKLTEEWLLKMGFEKAINGWFCSKEYLWLRQNKLNNQWFAGVNGIGDIDCKRIDYVHCLQNLYFALTGEELTFSTPKTS
jgi:hypothetical protein